MITAIELRAMKMLAKLEGRYFHMERYDPSLAAQLDPTNAPLSVSELHGVLRHLESKGFVSSICERLDGLIYALTLKGRALMEPEGFFFEEDQIKKTRDLFEKWFCKEPM